MAVKVLLAEDHNLVRSGIRALLERAEGFEVVGEAADGKEAVRLVEKLEPDVVVMDVNMPGMNGIEATRGVLDKRPQTFVIMLSMHDDRRYIYEALKAGASGYLLKDAAFNELADAIKSVVSGKTYLSPSVADVALSDYVRRAHGEREGPGVELLSPREREVLAMIAEGKSSSEMGKELHISVHTIDTHRRKIMEKLEIHNLAGLIKFAIRHGLTGLE